MTSIIFTAPRHFESDYVKTWAPGTLFVKNFPISLMPGDSVYVCHRNRILFRARWMKNEWREKISSENENREKGPVLVVGEPELAPREIPYRGHTGFSYTHELW